MATSRTPWRAALRGNVLAVGLVSFLTDLSSEMINPLLPIFVAGLASTGTAALVLGVMEGLGEATASLLKLVSGRLSDRLGKRKLLVLLGYSLSAVARPSLSLVGAGWQAVGLKFVDRVGKGIRTSPRDALIGDAAPPDRRALAFSFHRAMDHFGAALGPLVALALLAWLLGDGLYDPAVAGSVAEHEALRIVFAAALIPGLMAIAVIVLLVRELAPPAAPADAAPPTPLPRRFYGFVAAATLFALGNSSDLFLLLYARERFGYGVVGLLLTWLALELAKTACSLPGGLLADRFGRRPAILAGWAVYALVYLGLAFAEQPWQLWALLLAYAAYHGLTEGAAKALVTDFTTREQRATAFGVFGSAVGIAALPASVLFGALWAWSGPTAAFGVGAGLAGVAAVVLLALGPPPR